MDKNRKKKVLNKKIRNIVKYSLIFGLNMFAAGLAMGEIVFTNVLGITKVFLALVGSINFSVGVLGVFPNLKGSINDYFITKKNIDVIEDIENTFKQFVLEDEKKYNEKKKEYEKTKFILNSSKDYQDNKSNGYEDYKKVKKKKR